MAKVHTIEYRCVIEEAARPGTHRCAEQCESCLQQFLPAVVTGTAHAGARLNANIETFSGLHFDYDNPKAESISLVDVATHLANTCRFGGAIRPFYSVAEHAMWVRDLVASWGAGPDLRLAALHHDSHEYLLGDWPTPLKRKLRMHNVTILDEIKASVDLVIAERFGFDPELLHDPLVKRADTEALYREASTLKKSRGTGPHWGRTEPAERIVLRERTTRQIINDFIATHRLDGGLNA